MWIKYWPGIRRVEPNGLPLFWVWIDRWSTLRTLGKPPPGRTRSLSGYVFVEGPWWCW